MNWGTDIHKTFRAAPWASQDDITDFLDQLGKQPAGEVLKVLGLLLDRGSRAEPAQHRLRCTVFGGLVERSACEDLFLPLVRSLDKADQVLRNVLVQIIPKVNCVTAHVDLCRVLASPDPDVRSAGNKLLQQVGGKTALEVLTAFAASPEFHGREEAMDALVPRAGHHALALLQTVLEHGDPRERAAAIKHLAADRIALKAPDETRAVIARALSEPDERVLVQVIVAFAAVASEQEFLDRVGEKLDARNPLIAKATLDGLKRFRSQGAIQLIAQRMRKGPNVVRLAAIDALETIATDDVIPPLVEALEHRQIVVRTRAADALSGLAGSQKVDLARTVMWLMRSRDVNVRRMAVEIARKVGDPTGELGPRLLRYMRDEDWWVRERVMDALVEMASLELARHLVEYLADPSDVVRRYAIGALRRIKDPRALGALVRTAADDTDWWVREQAVEAVGELGDVRAVPYLVDLMGRVPPLRRVCVEALRELRAREAAPQVANLLKEADSDLRLAIVRCLGELNDRAQAFALLAFESDGNPEVRDAICELLARWGMQDEADSVSSGGSASLLDSMLVEVARSEADDLLIATSRVPYMKRHGAMSALSSIPLSSQQLHAILMPCLSPAQREAISALQDVDFSYEVKSARLRFRAHVFVQLAGLSAVFRIVKNEIPEIDKLGLPAIVKTFSALKNGLVLVGGPTGSGKSTTLAALVDSINANEARHIVTIEDPIEVVHSTKKSLLNQREVGSHTRSFGNALRSTLREDPDVILVGEMRDYSTIAFAVSAAETGHLVFGTVHTASADTTVDRLVNAFPPAQQPQVRAMLAGSLRAVVCQHLLRRKDGPGRVLAMEVMINNDAVANLIRKGKAFQLPSAIATSRDAGMQSMDQELIRLVREGLVHTEEAFMKSIDKKAFETALAETQKQAAARQVPPDRTRRQAPS